MSRSMHCSLETLKLTIVGGTEPISRGIPPPLRPRGNAPDANDFPCPVHQQVKQTKHCAPHLSISSSSSVVCSSIKNNASTPSNLETTHLLNEHHPNCRPTPSSSPRPHTSPPTSCPLRRPPRAPRPLEPRWQPSPSRAARPRRPRCCRRPSARPRARSRPCSTISISRVSSWYGVMQV